MTSKFALVIANTEYQDASFAKLTAPGKDAEEFAQVLRAPELAAFDEVQVLLNEGEGKTRRAIARFFADRKPDNLLLLYFSGHGVRNEQGHLFLAANDTEKNILEATGIPAEFITRAMNNSRSHKQLLILDCCNSGAFAHGSKSASGVGENMGFATAFEGDGYGRVVLTATDATQFAFEGDKVIGNTQNSVFTHFLIEGLKGEADRDGDGRIKVDELYDYAYEQVVRRTPKQTPGKWTYKQQGDLVLRDNLKSRDVKPTPLPPDLFELLSYPNFGARKAGIQELTVLLEGKHLGLSRAAEEKLREMATNDASLDLRKMASDALIAHGLTVEQPVPIPADVPPETKDILPVPLSESPEPEKEQIEPGKSKKQPEKPEIIKEPLLLGWVAWFWYIFGWAATGAMIAVIENIDTVPIIQAILNIPSSEEYTLSLIIAALFFAMEGAIGGFITALILRGEGILADRKSVLWITLGWVVSWSIVLPLIVITIPDFTALSPTLRLIRSTFIWAISGAIGGFITALILRGEGILADRKSVLWITLGWAVGWSIAWVIYLWIEAAIPDSFSWSIFALTGAVIGRVIMLWQVRQEIKIPADLKIN